MCSYVACISHNLQCSAKSFVERYLFSVYHVPAKHVADLLNRELGWNKNTTYTLIKRCMKKGAIERTEPNFMCHALIPKEKVQEAETDELIDKVYDGSADKLFAALLGRKKLSAEQIANLRQIVETYEEN